MPISIPTKMSQFESVNSLSTASYIIGLDTYGGYLANIKISGSAAGYELSRLRWILNPPVSSPSDPRGDDGAESYDSSGTHWVKSGSAWMQIASSASYTSYAGLAGGLVTGANIDVNVATASNLLVTDSLVVTNLHVQNVTSSVELVTGSFVVSGELNAENVTASNILIYNNATISTSLDVLGASRLLGANTLINFETFGDGIHFISGSTYTVIASIINANSRVNFTAGQKLANGFAFHTVSSSYALSIGKTGEITTAESLGVGKSSTNARLDVNGDAIISGSLTSTSTTSSAVLVNVALDVLGASRLLGANTLINFETFGDGIWFVSGSSTPIGFITNASSRMNFSAGSKLTNGFVFNTNSTSGAVYITNDGSLKVYGSGGFGKTSTPNATLDVNGNAIISGSLIGLGGITGSLLGTASYALNAKNNNVYNVKDFGAAGDGITNDTTAIINAINAVQAVGYGTVYFPDGTFLITGSLTLPSNPQCDISLEGDGSNISTIKQSSNTHAVYFDISNGSGYENQYQVSVKGLGFKTSGSADAALYVTYGTVQYSQHQHISVDISDVHILSDESNYWERGIVLESAWNFRITNTMVVGKPTGSYPYNGTGLEVRRMCVNGSINQSQFNFWKTGIFVNTVDYTSAGMNTEGLFLDQIYMVPVHYGIYVRGNKSFFSAPFNSYDWAGRPIAGRMALFTFSNSHIDSRDSGSALLLENVQSHYITNNLMITDGTGSVVYGSNAHEGSFIGNTLFNAGSSPSIYLGGYSGSANIITGNIFRGGSTHVLLESSSIYNKVYGNVSYDSLNISITDAGTNNLTGSVGN